MRRTCWRGSARRAREDGAYVWQKLMKSGAIVANGTDVPVERIDPMANFHATVTRKTKDGSVFYGDQKMTRAEGAEVVHAGTARLRRRKNR